MGLYSDYLEQCRSRISSGEIDPCMIMRASRCESNNYNNYYKKLQRFKNINTSQQEKLVIRQEVIEKSLELEQIKVGYLLTEKIILQIENKNLLCSQLIKDIIGVYKEQIHKGYQAICDLRQEIDRHVGKVYISAIKLENEERIRKDILERLINSIILYMNEGVIAETSSCRKVVNDCAELIRYMEQEQYSMANKEVVMYYLEKTFKLRKSQHRCVNCHESLYEEVPYCLNCYERNL